MAKVGRKRDGAAASAVKRRLTAAVDDELFRRVGAFCKMRGVTLGAVVQTALEVHLRGFYFVDRGGETSARTQETTAAAPVGGAEAA